MRVMKRMELCLNEFIIVLCLHEEHDIRRDSFINLLNATNGEVVPQPLTIPSHYH